MSVIERDRVPAEIPCKTCQHFLKYHAHGGIIPTQSSVVKITEPYIMCSYYKYAILAENATKCPIGKHDG